MPAGAGDCYVFDFTPGSKDGIDAELRSYFPPNAKSFSWYAANSSTRNVAEAFAEDRQSIKTLMQTAKVPAIARWLKQGVNQHCAIISLQDVVSGDFYVDNKVM